MASLAAYNGAVLNGQFAEFDERAGAADDSASTAMYQYEDACVALAAPWDQPRAPAVTDGDALQAERHTEQARDAGPRDHGMVAGGSHVEADSPPLTPFRVSEVKDSAPAPALEQVRATAAAQPTLPVTPTGGYGPLGALGRGDGGREHQSSLHSATTDDQGGEAGAALSSEGVTWLPTAQRSDTPFLVSDVSWDAGTPAFDEPAVSDGLESLGVDKGLTL